MVKSLILGIIALLAGVFIIAGTKIYTPILVGKLANFTRPETVLIVLAGALFIFFAFFSANFFIWFQEQTREKFIRKSVKESIIQFSILMVGAVFAAAIVGSFGAMLFLAEQVSQYLFWALFIIFMFLLFVSARRQDKIEKRLHRNRANWWRG